MIYRVRKMKRPTSFDSSRLQIQMKGGTKKQEKNTAKPEARSTRQQQQQQNSQGRPSPTKRAGNRAKRNLTFDDEGTGGGGPRVPPRRSPRKRVRSDSVAEGGGDSGEKTPSKKRARLAEETPQKMTPGIVPFSSVLFPLALLVFQSDDPQQNVNSFLTSVFNTVFMLYHTVPFFFLSMVAKKPVN